MEVTNFEPVQVLNYGRIADSIAKRAYNCSKVNVKLEDVEKTVNELMKYVELFNSLGAYDNRVLDRDFDQIEIINEFAGFVTPRSVRLTASDLNTTDLLVRTEVGVIEKVAYNYESFVNLQLKFRGYFKKDSKTEVTKLSSIKVDESLSNVLPRAAVIVNDILSVRYVSDPFIPIALASEVGYFYRNEYFNSTAQDVITDYLLPIIY